MTWTDWINTVQCMDCLEGMKQMPEGVVHCVVTSPPYYGLRDYGTATWEGGDVDCDHKKGPLASTKSTLAGYTSPNVKLAVGGMPQGDICSKCHARRVDPQLGLEHTPELYVSKMVEVFREVKRIMHPTGTLWLNMGDSYWGSGGPGGDFRDGKGGDTYGRQYGRVGCGLKPKDLLEMPSRLVLALQADGWWLRCRIPWLKRNAMPESVQGSRWERHRVKTETNEWQECPGCPKCDPNDGLVLRMSAGRPTQAVEYVFLLQKSPECYYDGEAVRVGSQIYFRKAGGYLEKGSGIGEGTGGTDGRRGLGFRSKDTLTVGRSLRNSDFFFQSWQGLWTDENGEPLAFIVNPKPFKGSHFATFPPGLVIPCVKAGTSERGACPECGSPWVRVVETGYIQHGKATAGGRGRFNPEDNSGFTGKPAMTRADKTLGWRPTCDCGKEPVPCLCFDPFAGTGTVIEVARKMGRNGLGFEISEEYVKKYCGERLAQGVLTLETK